MVLCAFFVFQSSVSIDQRIAGVPRLARTALDASLIFPPGGRITMVLTPAMDWSVSSIWFKLARI